MPGPADHQPGPDPDTGTTNAKAGYVLDADYLYDFSPDHGPAWLNTVAALNGVAPRPLADGFTWCDVGCGHGVSALALAAALPRGRFLAGDAATLDAPLPAARAWLLLGLCTVGRAQAPAWTRQAMDAMGRHPERDGRRLGADEAHALLASRMDALFEDGWIAKLVQLGVLAVA